MSEDMTAEQVEEQYIAAMGPDLGRLFYRFWNECEELHWKWGEYVTLFGTKPERIDLLNAAAGSFFVLVQDSLWKDILLHIARLTDPPKSAGKDNLTLQRLPPIVDETIRACVEKLLQTFLAKCELARDWRNRRIAHRDLHLAQKDGAKPLKTASRQEVREALDSIAALLNLVQSHYCRSSTTRYGFIRPPGNAEKLLYVLRDGLEADARRRERLKSGNREPEDVKRPPV